MSVNLLSTLLFGKHSMEMEAFESALKRGDSKACLEVLRNDPAFAHQVGRSIAGHDTPLQMAVRYANPDICERLLSDGAEMDVVREYGGERASAMMTVAAARYDSVPNSDSVRAIFVKHYAERRHVLQSRASRRMAHGACSRFAKSLLSLIQEPVPPLLSVHATIEYYEAAVKVRRVQALRKCAAPGSSRDALADRQESWRPAETA